MDVISNNNSKIHCIYLPFNNRSKELPELSAEKVKNCFTLKQLPTTKLNETIYEYIFDENNETFILEQILNKIENVL
jgi:hypothetical protein